MQNWRYHLRSSLLSALGFGFGFAAGTYLSNLIFDSGLLDSALDLLQAGRLLTGLVLTLIVAGLAGAVGGAIGGLTLTYAHQSKHRPGYAWRGALSFGISYALIVVPLTLAVALMAFYELAEVSPIALMIPLAMMGAIFGAVSGTILGLLTVGRDTWRVVLVSTVSFALGGAGLGRGLFGYLFSLEDVSAGEWSIFAGIFIFGTIGGGALGFLYSWLARRKPAPSLPARFTAWFKQQSGLRRVLAVVGLIILVLALRAVWLISPFTAQSAPLNATLKSNTMGTRWAAPVEMAGKAVQPAIFALASGDVAIAWSQDAKAQTDVHYLTAGNSTPVNVFSSQTASTNPQLVADSQGLVHLVWVEDGSHILYSRCSNASCTPPVTLSSPNELDCLPDPPLTNDQPSIAIDQTDTLMITWRSNQNSLLYSTWSAAANPPATPAGCIPLDAQSDATIVQEPRLADGGEGLFSLIFAQLDNDQNGEIYLSRYTNGSWTSGPDSIGEGFAPEIFIDPDRQAHVAWCNPGEGMGYWNSAGQTEQIPFPRCTGRPGIVNRQGTPRLIWYSDEVENVNGVVQPNALLYESFRTTEDWTEPAIIAKTNGPAQPAVATDSEGTIHLTWAGSAGEPANLYYSTHTEYDCTGVELSNPGQAIFEVVRQEKFRPGTDPIPFCYNQYDRLMFAPNPVPAFSDTAPTPNGTFDKFAELAKTAQYEVVFATMWYDSFKQADNPGRVLGKAIAELYQNLRADPSRYPRGLTVRILLGNPPKFAFFPTFNNQVWSLINDLHAAGVPELKNDEIGWNLEVANFSGSWPHSHTKLMVVDGKTVQSVGYNMQHTHLPTDHPSGKGKGRIDLGLQVTGPVAQSSLQAFDELWQASTRFHCATIDPNESAIWILSCQSQPGLAEHVPEVLKYYIPDQPVSNAFSIFRTEKFKESDEAYYQALASATESIDTIHINFSLDTICALNLLVEACNFANRIDYMDAIMQAIEQHGVKVRVLVSDIAWVGIENDIAIYAFEDELAARGLSDNVEIRYFEQDMHIKSALIDSAFLIVGNQNFHYSAWGGGGSLAEYNLGTEDPEAIQDYQRFFNYYWDRATRRE